MKLWIVHGGEVSIHDQIVTQFRLAIASGALRSGERLPSTRQLARRHQLHPNTVSAAYRQLLAEGKVESRHGSGVYVRSSNTDHTSRANFLNALFSDFISQAKHVGFSDSQIVTFVSDWVARRPDDSFLLLEPDSALADIVTAELQHNLTRTIKSCTLEDYTARPDSYANAVVLVLPSKAERIRQSLPPHVAVVTLRISSVPKSLSEWLPAPKHWLIAIASHWPDFLKIARSMLVAAGFTSDSLIECDTRKPNWKRGLAHVSGVLCDVVTSQQLSSDPQVVCFRIVAETSLDELKKLDEEMGAQS